MADKQQQPADDKAKMIKIGLIVVIFAVMGYFMLDMIGIGGGGGDELPTVIKKPNPDIPKKVSLMTKQEPEPKVLTERERQLIQLQKETEAKYIAALNELQILRIESEIAKTKSDIAKSKLKTITDQQDIVEILTPKPPKSETELTQDLTNTIPSNSPGSQPGQGGGLQQQMGQGMGMAASSSGDVKYSLVSVTKLGGKWEAVIGAKGKLYRVAVGDILSPTSEVVMSINPSGIVLEKDGNKRKLSMVPII